MDLKAHAYRKQDIDPWLSREYEDHLDWLENHRHPAPSAAITFQAPALRFGDASFRTAFWFMITITVLGGVASFILP